ncbi:HRDC domain-containing protein [Acidipropionibacterium virtanenii]|uniref:Ribonuclease D n=1 Tax=Acidipropionibacterium virtanenii TaxID=2057246 RepID=A0A344UUH5_9ACTN|nr:HRDC domain-containing protein [Acidipropionibacterium virtanenii]AXE38923.1 Ribonuclease D [Acidipropionibacterium virtanenii]
MTESDLPVLSAPAEGVPPLITTASALRRTAARLASGTGPVAIDTERAHGYRYDTRAYLIQLRREGAGSHLVDPAALDSDGPGSGLSPLAEALAGTEWILHAATQDMPCLVREGLRPSRIFDTELAGRLLGLPRVGLGPMVEEYFGVHLLKEHSAADWSTRPLPADWLVYAALDVELLIPLRDRLADDLAAAGKAGWALEEFEHLTRLGAELPDHLPEPDPSRWRRTSGLHDVRTRAGLELVKDLWWAREGVARRIDIAPGRIVNDRALSALGVRCGERVTLERDELLGSSGFRRGRARRHTADWERALERARGTAEADYPPRQAPQEGPPPPRSWDRHHPDEAARWKAIRPAVNRRAEELDLPPENLISPDWLRRLAWQPPVDRSPVGIDAFLADLGARTWQRNLVCGELSRLLGGLR